MGHSRQLGDIRRMSRPLSGVCLILVIVVVFSMCERPTVLDEALGATVRDSAGIRIIENYAAAWTDDDVWVIDSEPEFVIGGSTGTDDVASLVWDIAAAARLSDGMVPMLSRRGDLKLLVFESTGSLFASFARRGRGPGEFASPQHLQVLPGDTIVVWDHAFGPISYFDPSGTLLKDRRVDLGHLFEVLRPDGQRPGESVRLPLPDGSFILETRLTEWEPPTQGYFRRPLQYVRIDSTYSANSLGWWEGPEQFRIRPPANVLGFLPFPANSSVGAGGDPLSVYVTNGDRYEIYQYSVAGVLQRIIRVMVDPISITSAELDEWMQGMKAANPNMDWGAWEREVGELSTRRFRPPVSRLLVDSQGYLWVYSGMGDWNVFSEEGRWLGTLEMPGGRTLWVGDDLIIRRRTHPDSGVETVEGYRLERPTVGSSPKTSE